MEYEDKMCEFKEYAKRSLDLMVDAYKWKAMAEECDNEEAKQKYMGVSNTLFELFMKEHANMQNYFKKEE